MRISEIIRCLKECPSITLHESHNAAVRVLEKIQKLKNRNKCYGMNRIDIIRYLEGEE